MGGARSFHRLLLDRSPELLKFLRPVSTGPAQSSRQPEDCAHLFPSAQRKPKFRDSSSPYSVAGHCTPKRAAPFQGESPDTATTGKLAVRDPTPMNITDIRSKRFQCLIWLSMTRKSV